MRSIGVWCDEGCTYQVFENREEKQIDGYAGHVG
jgi:hypothetical protein